MARSALSHHFQNHVILMEFILSAEETRELETADVWVADIEPVHTKRVLAVFDKRFSLKELSHLKRIRREDPVVSTEAPQQTTADAARESDSTTTEGTTASTVPPTPTLSVVLAICDAAPLDELQACIDTNELAAVVVPRRVAVSRWPPLTRTQYDAWKHTWPMYWRESAARRDPLTAAEHAVYADLMRSLLPLASAADDQGAEPPSSRFCGAGLAYQPGTKSVVARAHDTRHATGHPLQHTALNLIEAVAAADRARGAALVESSPTSTTAKKRKAADAAYLCAGLVMVLTHEPCIMCSMALLHSRVDGVVYGVASPATGGMGSLIKVHTERALNHKFLAWRNCEADAVEAAFGVRENHHY
ncbi:tRNA-specific adenosine deaminase subunit tad3 [Blastocladiella emersonii ATCC 22665]|nr:tRNA-specific adenosine deaminase subunit tad3 [Blastocladiella emersonii ATCC 22665]